jgi:hypothetical protein
MCVYVCGVSLKVKVKVKVAGGVLWHFSHLGFLYPDPEGIPSFISRGAARRTTAACDPDLLHAAKLGHGTDSFTSPPKEGMLRIFNTR